MNVIVFTDQVLFTSTCTIADSPSASNIKSSIVDDGIMNWLKDIIRDFKEKDEELRIVLFVDKERWLNMSCAVIDQLKEYLKEIGGSEKIEIEYIFDRYPYSKADKEPMLFSLFMAYKLIKPISADTLYPRKDKKKIYNVFSSYEEYLENTILVSSLSNPIPDQLLGTHKVMYSEGLFCITPGDERRYFKTPEPKVEEKKNKKIFIIPINTFDIGLDKIAKHIKQNCRENHTIDIIIAYRPSREINDYIKTIVDNLVECSDFCFTAHKSPIPISSKGYTSTRCCLMLNSEYIPRASCHMESGSTFEEYLESFERDAMIIIGENDEEGEDILGALGIDCIYLKDEEEYEHIEDLIMRMSRMFMDEIEVSLGVKPTDEDEKDMRKQVDEFVKKTMTEWKIRKKS